eukprot:35688_1
MQKYFDQFKQNECGDMDSIELFDDDILTNDIGIKSKILRKKVLKHCNEMKNKMIKFKSAYGISSTLYEKLAKYGIVTLHILCDQVLNKNDLPSKFEITNANQIDLIWNIITQETNIIANNDNEGGTGTPYI